MKAHFRDLAMTPDVAVVIPLKLVYTPVDDDVTALICSQSQSQRPNMIEAKETYDIDDCGRALPNRPRCRLG